MKLFYLMRHVDETGVSGTGIVGEGVVFSDGTVSMRWRGDIKSTVLYDSLSDVRTIHGHQGKTEIIFTEANNLKGIIEEIDDGETGDTR